MRAGPKEHAQGAAALFVDLPVPAERLVGGLAAAIVLGRGARLLRTQRRRRSDWRTRGAAAASRALHLRPPCRRRGASERTSAIIDPVPLAFAALPDGREIPARGPVDLPPWAGVHC